MKVRDLETRDIFTIAKMLQKITGEKRTEIIGMIKKSDVFSKMPDKKQSEEELAQQQVEVGIEVAFFIFDLLIEYAEKDIKNWFADLTEIPPEEFDKTNINTILEVIQELVEREDLADFFTNAWELYKKINGLAAKYTEKST